MTKVYNYGNIKIVKKKRGENKMLNSVKCTICNEVKKVNGQKGIEQFVRTHQHNQTDLDLKSNPKVELNSPEDRIMLKLDKPELVTYPSYNPNDKYLNNCTYRRSN